MTKTMTMTMTMTKTETMTMTFREHPQRATLESCDFWDIWSKRWGHMTLINKKTKTIAKTKTMTMTFREHPQEAILETCELWHTDYISDNLKQGTAFAFLARFSLALRFTALVKLIRNTQIFVFWRLWKDSIDSKSSPYHCVQTAWPCPG